jgi:hypothetical protein
MDHTRGSGTATVHCTPSRTSASRPVRAWAVIRLTRPWFWPLGWAGGYVGSVLATSRWMPPPNAVPATIAAVVVLGPLVLGAVLTVNGLDGTSGIPLAGQAGPVVLAGCVAGPGQTFDRSMRVSLSLTASNAVPKWTALRIGRRGRPDRAVACSDNRKRLAVPVRPGETIHRCRRSLNGAPATFRWSS